MKFQTVISNQQDQKSTERFNDKTRNRQDDPTAERSARRAISKTTDGTAVLDQL